MSTYFCYYIYEPHCTEPTDPVAEQWDLPSIDEAVMALRNDNAYNEAMDCVIVEYDSDANWVADYDKDGNIIEKLDMSRL